MINEKQIQTKDTFSFKWSKRDTYESNAVKQKCSAWLLERYFGTNNEREYFLSRIQGKDLLDAGCGSGFSAALLFGKSLNALKYTGVDISDSVDTAKERFNELGLKGNFIKEDIALMHLNQTFDIIFSEGVIHHTSDPFKTFQNLISHLRGGGIIMFYVYKKKAPIREFTDDFIREKLKHMDNDQAWNALIPLTKLGRIIGDLNIEIELDEDIEILEISKGKYNLQRLLYWYFLKMYYDPGFSLDEMNHTNFDWYRPLNCHRFTPEEIKQWLKKLKLCPVRFVVQDAGITVIAKKESALGHAPDFRAPIHA